MGFRVEGLGLMVWGLGCRVYGAGFRAEDRCPRPRSRGCTHTPSAKTHGVAHTRGQCVKHDFSVSDSSGVCENACFPDHGACWTHWTRVRHKYTAYTKTKHEYTCVGVVVFGRAQRGQGTESF